MDSKLQNPGLDELVSRRYQHGFVTDIESDTVAPGHSEDVIRFISHKKEEPEFLLDWRLKAYRHWLTMREPAWARLHYPPIEGDTEGCIRAGAHEDINLITLLLGAEESGLQILRPDGTWMDVSPPEGGLSLNVGDMLQRLCNHFLPSTTHRVRNPMGERSRFSRYSMPFFLHLNSDYPITTLPQCISDDNPNRYPEPILADDYLKERLIEIGLLKT